jgi:hypothetical protein
MMKSSCRVFGVSLVSAGYTSTCCVTTSGDVYDGDADRALSGARFTSVSLGVLGSGCREFRHAAARCAAIGLTLRRTLIIEG